MASTRRPTYRPSGSGKPAGSGKPVSSGNRTKTPETQKDVRPGVITASKSAPAAAPEPRDPARKPARNPAGKPAADNRTRPAKPGEQGTPEEQQSRTQAVLAAAKRPWRKRTEQQAPPHSGKTNGGKTNGANANGAEPDNVLAFPEPKGKRIRRNVIMAACVAAALVAGMILAAVYSPVLAVKTVTVSGTKLLKATQVQAALKPLEGTPLPQVNDEEVERLLKPLVQIKSVSTQARPPSELVVQVQERVPVALVKRGAEYLLVDVEGVRLTATADPANVKLPVIDGGAGAIGKDLFQATTAVLGALPATVLAKLSNASAKSVDAVELKLVDGQTIIWGNESEKELKARVLEALLKVPADPANPVNVYDVSVPRHPVTR
ncbi:cell division protein FtsQ [Arthrobacter pascens]|uniref:cell division protein FtsQ/DivIB n=1 Tax=Arthrobacter pascens TaxID=1677 RepID=UPI0028590C12|nr:FtsQ-type POTRA domain-containing protein [Arthrobacter pascens]MDR6559104.1 cell division protein FtsQ [Arthrobacter pascens]